MLFVKVIEVYMPRFPTTINRWLSATAGRSSVVRPADGLLQIQSDCGHGRSISKTVLAADVPVTNGQQTLQEISSIQTAVAAVHSTISPLTRYCEQPTSQSSEKVQGDYCHNTYMLCDLHQLHCADMCTYVGSDVNTQVLCVC